MRIISSVSESETYGSGPCSQSLEWKTDAAKSRAFIIIDMMQNAK